MKTSCATLSRRLIAFIQRLAARPAGTGCALAGRGFFEIAPYAAPAASTAAMHAAAHIRDRKERQAPSKRNRRLAGRSTKTGSSTAREGDCTAMREAFWEACGSAGGLPA